MNQPETAVSLHFQPEAHLLEVVWNQPVSSDELRAVYRKVLQQVRDSQLCHVLFDIRQRGTSSEADQLWVMREFLPTLAAHAGKCIRLAYLVTPDLYDFLTVEMRGNMINSSELLLINHFTSPEAARHWLQEAQS